MNKTCRTVRALARRIYRQTVFQSNLIILVFQGCWKLINPTKSRTRPLHDHNTFSCYACEKVKLPVIYGIWSPITVSTSSRCLNFLIYLSIYVSVYLSVCLSIYLQPFVGPWPLFSFLILHTVGRAPWSRDQPVARPLPMYKTTHRHPYVEWDSNPRSQRSSERRQFMSQTARPWYCMFIKILMRYVGLSEKEWQLNCASTRVH
jgi:hypothetical protein